MSDLLTPRDAADIAAALAEAAAARRPVEVIGRGSKRPWGKPTNIASGLLLESLSGVTLYEPDELVLTALPGTPLEEIEALLAANQQQLAFEPPDFGPLYGGSAGQGSLGGVLATNLSGPRRIAAGAARDHLLGYRGVNGLGVPYKAGSRVVKNVTGYDLPKLMCGSFGTLSVLTEVTVKVLPRPEKTRTLLIAGQRPEEAVVTLSDALGSPHEVSGAAYVPASVAGGMGLAHLPPGQPVTAIRVEGFGPSVAARCEALRREHGESSSGSTAVDELHSHNSRAFWAHLADAAPLAARPDLIAWRVSVPPMLGAALVRAVGEMALFWFDWGGGLVWLGLEPGEADAGAARVRKALAQVAGADGQAVLMRAPDTVRATVPVFQPVAPAQAALLDRVRHSFDPHGILTPGRIG